jgi:hypothetical protein
MIDPTRKEWQAALKRANIVRVDVAPTHAIVEAVLGPCPPKPPPEPFRSALRVLVWISDTGELNIPPQVLTPDEADAMAEALVEHADYAREQGEAPEPKEGPIDDPPEPCRRGWPLCQRPKGHTGACKVGA